MPTLINLYDDIQNVTLIMEPPHNSFWIQASPDLHPSLKKRVVDTYIKLHRRGVLHGSVEMRNILIGADCRVTLVDFSQARSSTPALDVDLGYADKKDFHFELREVMYKLDYEGARTREEAKTVRLEEAMRRNKANHHLMELLSKGHGKGPTLPDIFPITGDIDTPPMDAETLQQWREAFAGPKIRFEIPGQTEAQREAAVTAFRAEIQRLASHEASVSTSPLLVEVPSSRLPVANVMRDFAPSWTNPSKRKAVLESSDSEEPASKRARDEQVSQPRNPEPEVVYKCKPS